MPRWIEFPLTVGLLCLALPVMLLIALLLKINGSPVVFQDRRLGKNTRPFCVFKFHTMVPNAKQELNAILEKCPQSRHEWQTKRKIIADPRVTKIGYWLRRFSLDELPQLFNVLKGDMALVGPRPITEEELHFYGKHVSSIFSVKPGMTGLWQVSGRNEIAWPRRTAMNVFYARRRSCCFDFNLIARTLRIVINGRGAF